MAVLSADQYQKSLASFAFHDMHFQLIFFYSLRLNFPKFFAQKKSCSCAKIPKINTVKHLRIMHIAYPHNVDIWELEFQS